MCVQNTAKKLIFTAKWSIFNFTNTPKNLKLQFLCANLRKYSTMTICFIRFHIGTDLEV